jgi:hypothetical protein
LTFTATETDTNLFVNIEPESKEETKPANSKTFFLRCENEGCGNEGDLCDMDKFLFTPTGLQCLRCLTSLSHFEPIEGAEPVTEGCDEDGDTTALCTMCDKEYDCTEQTHCYGPEDPVCDECFEKHAGGIYTGGPCQFDE